MSRLSKAQAKAHGQAVELLEKDVLTFEEKLFVLEHWQESANHVNSTAGAFFTPYPLASDFALECQGVGSVIDLCAGIGTLTLAVLQRNHCCRWADHADHRPDPRLVCVELNTEYVAVGRKIVPEAEWINASVFDLPADLGPFDLAISNPPFGAVDRAGGSAPRYSGRDFEYHVIDIAAHLARFGTFIIPAMSAPFRYSGERHYVEQSTTKHDRFVKQTGIELGANCGIDTSIATGLWHGVAPVTEIVTAEFDPAPAPEVVDAAATGEEQAVLW